MKRMRVITVVLFAVFLCIAATAMAGESSFFDTKNEWIVRAYTDLNDNNQQHSIFVEILKEDGTDYFTPLSEILLNGQALTSNPFLIDANQVTDAISLAYKYVNGGTEIFVFGTEVEGVPAKVHNNRILSRNWPVAPANISVSGSGSFGNVNVGSSSTSYFSVSNTGEADLILGAIAVSGTGFSRDGGACSEGTHVLATPCTIGVKFAPTQATSYTGNLAIPSNDGDTPIIGISLTGTGVQQTVKPDLILTSTEGIGSSYNAGSSITITTKVKNQGLGSSSACNLKVTQAGTTIGTFPVGALAPGVESPYTISVSPNTSCSIHEWCTFKVIIDGDKVVAESNETNNTYSRDSYRGR